MSCVKLREGITLLAELLLVVKGRFRSHDGKVCKVEAFVYSFHFLPKLFILKFSKNPIPIPLTPSDPALKVSSQTHMHPALKAMERRYTPWLQPAHPKPSQRTGQHATCTKNKISSRHYRLKYLASPAPVPSHIRYDWGAVDARLRGYKHRKAERSSSGLPSTADKPTSFTMRGCKQLGGTATENRSQTKGTGQTDSQEPCTASWKGNKRK
jgi:hypothetical protein